MSEALAEPSRRPAAESRFRVCIELVMRAEKPVEMYYNNMDTIETAIYPCQRREVADNLDL
jgi:hypothetical protein